MNVAASTPGVPNCLSSYGGWGLGVPFAGVYMLEKAFLNSGENWKTQRECYIISTRGRNKSIGSSTVNGVSE